MDLAACRRFYQADNCKGNVFSAVVFLQLLSCPNLCDAMDCSMPGFPVLHHLLQLAQTHRWFMSSNHLVLCGSLLLLLSILPSIRVFSNESALHIRGPKYWNFSISPSNEYSGLVSLGLTDLISLLSKGLSRVFFSTIV